MMSHAYPYINLTMAVQLYRYLLARPVHIRKMMSMIRSLLLVVGALAHHGADAGASCGGFDLANQGQARQCLTDSGSRNGCMNRLGVRNSCWRSTSQSSCCNHGTCSGVYDRYNSHCTCSSGWKGKKCNQRSSPAPSGGSSGLSSCRDSTNTGFTSKGRKMTCHDLRAYCKSAKYGATIKKRCCVACGGKASSGPPAAPPPAPQCPSSERNCGKQTGCGWCIAGNYNSKCVSCCAPRSFLSKHGETQAQNCKNLPAPGCRCPEMIWGKWISLTPSLEIPPTANAATPPDTTVLMAACV